ncbi:MAG: response regulator transcription factor [Aquabacterium sp.]|nr:response regulator transcription factor [Aquabacterium sp.]
MSLSRTKFLLVDDHGLFRTGLGLMLSQVWPDGVVVQAASWGEALRALQTEVPDLILLDVGLPDGHGLLDLPVLRVLAPHCPVLLMSAEVNAEQIVKAREYGAMGFLPKSATASEVMSAVGAALSGQPAFAALSYEVLSPAGDAVGAVGGVGAPSRAALASEAMPPLSARQIDILRHLGRNTPNKALARQLGMSESDVRAEVSWLTEWLGASSREEAHAQALARGLLAP